VKSRGLTVLPCRRSVALLILLSCLGCGPEDKRESANTADGTCALSECHGKVERIHYGGPNLTCVACHLGNADDRTKEGAHVTVDVSFNPSTPGTTYLDKPSMAELDAIDPDIIQFLNPADYRVARRACGSAGLGGAQCHIDIVESSLLLNRATLVGTMAGGGFIAGAQDKSALYGVVAANDVHIPTQLPEGFVASVEQLPAATPAGIDDELAKAFFPAFEQLCVECHLYRDGPRIPGRYYSSGCNGCHMLTDDEARAKTNDPTQDREELGHVSTHRFTNMIPDTQCAHCHISHLGRSLLAIGVRERSEPHGDAAIDGPNRGVDDPKNAVPWAEKNYVKYEGKRQIYGKPYPYFIEDEDGTKEGDETPQDIHTEKLMGCIDCHNIREAHGDSRLAVRMDSEIDVRCQSCHGLPGQLGPLTSDAGLPFNIANTTVGNLGTNKGVFEVNDDGTVMQLVRFTGALHPVTQITHVTDPMSGRHNPRTRMGCELHAGSAAVRKALKEEVNERSKNAPDSVAILYPGLPPGFTFEPVENEVEGRTECFTCHNTWTLNCYGCHMVRDDSESYRSLLTGETKQGKVSSFGLSVVADALAMGFNTRGKISPMVGTSIFFSHKDGDGKTLIDAQPFKTGDGLVGEGNVHNPVHHHTTRKEPRDCDGCHPSALDSHDSKALLTAVGLGSGRFNFIDGNKKVHLLDRLVTADYDGDGKVDDPVTLGLPTSPLFSAEAVVGTTHKTILPSASKPVSPGPLDLATINRILKNVVLPQR